MGFIFLLLLICLGIAFLCYIACDRDVDSALVGFIVSGIIAMLLMAVIWGDSYGNSVAMQERLVSVEQYAQTIKTYANRGVAEFKGNSGREMTDLKYNNYQTQIGEMITDLRDQINRYNTKLVGKDIMGKHWFWNWCIIPAPEGSVLLKMSDYIE